LSIARSPADSSSPDAESADLPPAATSRHRWAVVSFCIFLALHAFLVSRNWDQGFLIGHEFRQTQTALSIAFIGRDNDYSLAYPTPLFGPPWSIPMEFPLYQWAAAWLVQKTDWSVPESARSVSLLCFYLTLPAVFFLLKELRFTSSIRWGTLSLLLTTPVYIFYSRSVLIESMALMFSLWFVACFVRMCRTRSYGWMAIASAVGSAAALVKVTSMMAWCFGIAIGGLWWSWQQWRSSGPTAWRRSILLGIGCALPPGILTLWWLQTADTIKAASPGGSTLVSSNMTEFNFGSWSDRIDLAGWVRISHHFSLGVTPVWILGLAAVVGLFALFRRQDIGIAAGSLWLVSAPLTFPILYQIHDYYFYAIAVLSAFVIAAATQYTTQKIRTPWLPTLIISLVAAFQLNAYRINYAPNQKIVSNGGTAMDILIRDLSEPEEVIIIIGQDWSAATPYYAQRRAFMFAEPAFDSPASSLAQLESLGDETIAGLLVSGQRRSEEAFIATVTHRLGLDSTPTASSERSDLYLPPSKQAKLLRRLALNPNNRGITAHGIENRQLPPLLTKIIPDGEIHEVTPDQVASLFSTIYPPPARYRAQFGFSSEFIELSYATGAHPDSDLWIEIPTNSTHLDLSFGLREESYAEADTSTNGVEFIVTGFRSDRTEVPVFQQFIDPFRNPDQRGPNQHSITLPPENLVTLKFSTRPGPDQNYAFDWAYWTLIDVR